MTRKSFAGTPMTDHLVASLAGLTRDEFLIAVANGELPPSLPRKQGTGRRWDEEQIMQWIACRQHQRRARA